MIEAVGLDTILIHFHVAKTGGTTLADVVGRFFPQEQQFDATTPTESEFGVWGVDEIAQKWGALPLDRRRDIRLTGGHVPFGVHKVFGRPARYFGLVREPAEQFISSFFYGYANVKKRWGEITILDFLHANRNGIYCNPQVRHYSGAADTEVITRDHLEVAKRNVDNHFLFVAPTQAFDYALLLLRSALDLDFKDLVYVRKNVNSRKPAQTRATKAALRVFHSLDVGFYSYCCSRIRKLMLRNCWSMARDHSRLMKHMRGH